MDAMNFFLPSLLSTGNKVWLGLNITPPLLILELDTGQLFHQGAGTGMSQSHVCSNGHWDRLKGVTTSPPTLKQPEPGAATVKLSSPPPRAIPCSGSPRVKYRTAPPVPAWGCRDLTPTYQQSLFVVYKTCPHMLISKTFLVRMSL
jgi:hypothetical protein